MLAPPIHRPIINIYKLSSEHKKSIWWKENEKAQEKAPKKEKVQVAETKAGTVKKTEEPLKKTITKPGDDKSFQNIIKLISGVKETQKKHPAPSEKVKETQSAVKVDPEIEKSGIAMSEQVVKMSEQKKGKFDAKEFKKKLMQSIKDATPKNENEVKDFKDNNKLDEAKNEMSEVMSSEKENAAGEIKNATGETIDTASVKIKQSAPLTKELPGNKPSVKPMGLAAPKAKPESETNMDADAEVLDTKMSENDITETQLDESNEPSFKNALKDKKSAQTKAKSTTSDYKKLENPILLKSEAESNSLTETGVENMYGVRTKSFNNIQGQKTKSKTKEEKIRTTVSRDLQNIYNKTKLKVTTILDNLDINVNKMFDYSLKYATTQFETNVNKGLEANGFFSRIGRAIFGGEIPPEIDKIFDIEKKKFEKTMSICIDEIAKVVETELNRATEEIANGKSETEKYWNSQSADVKMIAGDIYSQVNEKYTELENQVQEKQDSLIQNLTDKYVAAAGKLKETFEKLKEENKSWLEKALDAIKDTIKAIKDLKNMLFNVLKKASKVIGDIAAHPIKFLSNLVDAVGKGFKNFSSKILVYLEKGIVDWLLGAMPAEIEFPKDWTDIKEIFKFVLSILGLTWNNIRARAVKKLGEPVVNALEKAFEIFQIIRKEGIKGLWNYIKEQIGNLKDRVIEQIKNMIITEVIKKGILFVLSLMNPASAFIKACKMIYDIIIWFVNNAKRIIQLIESIVDSTALIVAGKLDAAATKVEESLAKIIPITIGFIASILGIGNLADKAKKIIQDIQKPINNAIDWVLDKAVSFAKKTGLIDLVKKGKAYVEGKIEKGKALAKEKGSKLLSLLGLQKKFKGNDGKIHTLSFKGKKANPKLKIASEEKDFDTFLNSVKTNNNSELENRKIKSKEIYSIILQLKNDFINKTNVNPKNNTEKIEIDNSITKIKNEINIQFSFLIDEIRYLINVTGSFKLTLLPTNVYGFGTFMKVVNLNKGTRPTTGSKTNPNFTNDYYEKLSELKFEGRKRSYYVKGHLLNADLGGSGIELKNLTPLSYSGNALHKTQIEEKAKTYFRNGDTIDYEVKPEYTDKRPEKNIYDIENITPVHLICKLKVYDKNNPSVVKDEKNPTIKNPIEHDSKDIIK
jgi:hypothetical protein